MGKRGPAKQPTNLTVLKGGKGNPDEVTPPPGEIVMPDWVADHTYAAETWDRLAPTLITAGLLTPWDIDNFGLFCRAMALARQALAEMDADLGEAGVTIFQSVGNGGSRQAKHPAIQVARDAAATAKQLGALFGLSPSDRATLSIGGEGGDALDRILGGG